MGAFNSADKTGTKSPIKEPALRLPGESLGEDLDHAVIGPTGIYAIETKTHAKPLRGNHDVVYDGECITVNGFKPDRDPLIQSVAIAKELARLIQSLTGRKYYVQPVVFFPGWFVRKNCASSPVWVLNPGQFGSYLRYEKPDALSTDEVNQITALLEKQVRGQGKKVHGGYEQSA